MSLWLGSQPLVLASKSRVRQAVLDGAGIPIEVRPADLDERTIEANENNGRRADASAVALLLAKKKAVAVAGEMPGRVVLGADQTLAYEGGRLSKPKDRGAAAEQLRMLRGKTHSLHSAIAIVRDGEELFSHVQVAILTMRDFSERFLQAYLDAVGDDAMRSVGAYQLEGLGSHLFAEVEGDYFTVLGLPLLPLLDFLRRSGLLAA